MGSYFSFKGRLNRLKYFLILLIVNVIMYAIYFVLGMLLGTSAADAETGAGLAGMIGFIVSIIAAVVCAFAVVKRLHDIERPGAHFWMLLIPVYNIILLLILFFKKGTAGKNKYGPDPLA